MPGRIHLLPEALSRMIAAGEVIERPASVVKELIENALDADASEITVDLEAGGLHLIRVLDNGIGMDREDAVLSLQRHATSKIHKVDDLYAIETLGFRGEALPSIASVSSLLIKTRPHSALQGTRLVCQGGVVQNVSDTGCPAGTEIEVRNLFFNLPVKRKFLRSTSLELRHSLTHFLRLSLSHPPVTFRFIHEGRTLQEHLRTQSLLDRADAVLGREVARQLQPFDHVENGLSLSGLVSLPTFSRGNGDGIYLYVNRRFIKDRALFKAILEAYRHVIPQGRFPVVLLFLSLPPSAVDVNVHPTKTEVKFREPDRVFSAVLAGLRCLHAPVPSAKPFPRGDGKDPIPDPPFLAFPLPKADPAYRIKKEGEDTSFRVSEGALAGPRNAVAPPFRILGQVQRTYILYEDPEGLVLVDQHAAHERILYEKLKKAFEARSLEVVRFLTPLLLDCSPEESLRLNHHLQDLQNMGFEIDPAGERTYAVRSVPALIDHENPGEVIRDILGEWAMDHLEHGKEETLAPVLTALSCHGAVRANVDLNTEEIKALLMELGPYPSTATCPHGRPIFFRLPHRELARRFKRNIP